MDHLSIDIPEGLDEAAKAALAKRLSRIAQQSVAANGHAQRGSAADLAGRLASDRPRLSDQQEREIAQQHVAELFRDRSR